MKLAEYQHLAERTAQPAAYDHKYLVPMIVGELGELFGQQAKSVWHGWPADKLQLELTLEYGDIAWGTAILLGMHDVTSTGGYQASTPTTIWGSVMDPWQVLLQRASGLHLFHTQAETQRFIPTAAAQLWLGLEEYCETITGSSWDTVLHANLDKLASRAARGVLQGAGDHR